MSRQPKSPAPRLLFAALAWLAAAPTLAAMVDHHDGTVSDSVTGLMWDKCAWGQGDVATCAGNATYYYWHEALGVAPWANTSRHRGYSDWRLPNFKELESMINIDAYPAVDLVAFPNHPNEFHWASTTYMPSATSAFASSAYTGSTGAYLKNDSRFHVRLVRSGTPPAATDWYRDHIPDAFAFTAQSGVARSAEVISDAPAIAGITIPSPISVTGGEYRINGGAWTSLAGTVNNGQTVALRHTAAATYTATNQTTLTVGGVAATFTSTTIGAPIDGACGPAAGVISTFAPVTADLCASGSTGALTIASPWSWACTGINHGATVNCSAPNESIPANGGGIGGVGRAQLSGAGWTVNTAQSAGFIATSADPSGKSPAQVPAGYSFPHGLFDFTISGGLHGSTATITLTYPSALPANTVYWKYGPSPAGYDCTGAACGTAHWYRMPAARAVINGNSITLSIEDGGVGDDDLSANGIIVDAGGPGIPGLADIPTLSEWALLFLSLLLGSWTWRETRAKSRR